MKSKRVLSTILLICILLVQMIPIAYATESGNLTDDVIKDESMLIIPIVSMFGGNGMVVTSVLVGILIGICGTLLIQHFNRTKKK